MLNGIYQNAAAMSGLEAWNNAIAHNLSQASAPGFKKDMVSFDSYDSGSVGIKGPSGESIYRKVITSAGNPIVDFASGQIRHTGDPMEFAIEGKGFFALKTPNGDTVFTRDGQFKASMDGELVSKQGYKVLSDTGTPIQLIPNGGELIMAENGSLKQNGQAIGKFELRDVEDRSVLVRTHGGFAIKEGSNEKSLPVTSSVMQGALESSNVSSINEMVNLINVSRSFQINQRLISKQDDLVEKAIRSLGGQS